MNNKELKLIYNIDKNSRITTKELGRVLHSSQQSANYLLHNLEDETWILNYRTEIDPAKFGLTTVLVLYNYLDFSSKKEITEFLKKNEYITNIEEGSQGADIYVEFSTPNLSSINKENQEILHKFKSKIRQSEIYPIIVKHTYNRDYLSRNPSANHIIIAGDRDIEELSDKELAFLKMIQDDARASMISVAKKLKCEPKKILNKKKK